MKVLASEGISTKGVEILEKAGFEVLVTRVAQEQLQDFINKNEVAALIIGSSTKIDKELIDACPSLKVIGRSGLSLGNIEVKYAEKKGIEVVNTPEAPAAAVAELVFAHLFGGVRFLHDSNRNMPLEGETRFKELRKTYAGGRELRGKTLGIIGFGKTGQEVAKIALGLGMKVIASDKTIREENIELDFFNHQSISIPVSTEPLHQLIKWSDFISIHVPAQKEPLIGEVEINAMKDDVGIINTSRGGVIDEKALLDGLENGKISFAGLDAFENEPAPHIKVLMNEKVSLSPRIGTATLDARERTGVELAEKIIRALQ
ncbi:NAD(P)-dependent oxidoreductase [Zunongwangia sp. F363]|uniref:NAD(P)-dependent oxidoreductase n=1 Tax=Autumnicola tepida TaxID=3075595 RepID=A0ABU3CCJ3_9FLAO|nr:NAD(P)-dependent oxidoreductase [Zunongwangia sp. F363]MDT0644055.1 NAD(P)-dependent oxidoreductase [Zunongwangia sp. F363]